MPTFRVCARQTKMVLYLTIISNRIFMGPMFFIQLLGAEALALLCGILFFKYLDNAFGIFLLYLSISVSFDFIGTVLLSLHIPSNWLYNYLLLPDCFLQLYTASFFIKKQSFLWVLTLFAIIFSSFWCYDIFRLQMLNNVAVHAFMANFMILSIIYCYVLYTHCIHYEKTVVYSPVFWLCTASLGFYACCIPYFSIFNIIHVAITNKQQYHLTKLFHVIVNVRYLLVAYAFLLCYQNGKHLTRKTNET